MKMKILCCLLFVLQISTKSKANTIEKLWQEYNISNDAKVKIKTLLLIANLYDNANELTLRDSAYSLMISNSLNISDEENNIDFQTVYFNSAYLINPKLSYALLQSQKKLINYNKSAEWNYNYFNNSFKYYSSIQQKDTTLSCVERMNFYAQLCNNSTKIIEAMLASADILWASNQKIEAFKTYFNALYKAKESNNNNMINLCYEKISNFYFKLHLLDKAKFYKEKQFNFIAKNHTKESLPYQNFLLQYANILFQTKETNKAIPFSDSIISFAQKTNNKILLNDIFSNVRSYFIRNNDYKGLENFYTQKYPNELHKIEQTDTAMYYRLKAYFCDADNKTDSAIYYFNIAKPFFLKENTDNNMRSNFYWRLGNFYLKNKNNDEAINNFLEGFSNAQQAKNYTFAINNATMLDSLYNAQHSIDKAYNYLKKAILYKDSFNGNVKNDELFQLEIQSAEREEKLRQEKIKTAITTEHNAQYMLIVILIVVSFIILIILGSIKINKFLIEALGYISFIFLFEFIILITDEYIHNFTHGEPIRILGFKLVIISMLLPFHHWIEHKVVHYLIEHKLIDPNKISKNIKSFYLQLKNDWHQKIHIKKTETE